MKGHVTSSVNSFTGVNVSKNDKSGSGYVFSLYIMLLSVCMSRSFIKVGLFKWISVWQIDTFIGVVVCKGWTTNAI